MKCKAQLVIPSDDESSKATFECDQEAGHGGRHCESGSIDGLSAAEHSRTDYIMMWETI